MYLLFTTDNSRSSEGFQIRYESESASEASPQSKCSGLDKVYKLLAHVQCTKCTLQQVKELFLLHVSQEVCASAHIHLLVLFLVTKEFCAAFQLFKPLQGQMRSLGVFSQ